MGKSLADPPMTNLNTRFKSEMLMISDFGGMMGQVTLSNLGLERRVMTEMGLLTSVGTSLGLTVPLAPPPPQSHTVLISQDIPQKLQDDKNDSERIKELAEILTHFPSEMGILGEMQKLLEKYSLHKFNEAAWESLRPCIPDAVTEVLLDFCIDGDISKLPRKIEVPYHLTGKVEESRSYILETQKYAIRDSDYVPFDKIIADTTVEGLVVNYQRGKITLDRTNLNVWRSPRVPVRSISKDDGEGGRLYNSLCELLGYQVKEFNVESHYVICDSHSPVVNLRTYSIYMTWDVPVPFKNEKGKVFEKEDYPSPRRHFEYLLFCLTKPPHDRYAFRQVSPTRLRFGYTSKEAIPTWVVD